MIVIQQQALRLLAGFIRLVCGVRPLTSVPARGAKLYYANHTSHLDFTLLWAVLPQQERLSIRPVAGRDYWNRNWVTRFVGSRVFNALLIERNHVTRRNNPIEQMVAVAESGYSLIVFPEGTRGEKTVPDSFKSGLYHFSRACPQVPLIPVYLENLNRMLPKGTFLPIPLISRITVGEPLSIRAEASNRQEFLEAARAALVALGQ